MKTFSQTQIEKIVNDEIKKYLVQKLDDEVGKILKSSSSKGRKEAVEIAKDALAKFAEFMYVRKNVWKGDIK